MQCRRRRLLLLVLFPIPGAVAEAAQIRDSVSFPSIWILSWPWLAPRAAPGSRSNWFRYRWSVGSLLFLLSWAVLMGPFTYAKHLVSGSRLPFTAAYFGSIALTLYFAVGVSILFLYAVIQPPPVLPLDFQTRPAAGHLCYLRLHGVICREGVEQHPSRCNLQLASDPTFDLSPCATENASASGNDITLAVKNGLCECIPSVSIRTGCALFKMREATD